MRQLILAGLLIVPAYGCANANAATFDSSDPVQCMTIFGIAAAGAKERGQHELAEEMIGRQMLLAEQQGGVEWIKDMAPRSVELAQKMEAAQDVQATLELLNQCKARQNAGSAF